MAEKLYTIGELARLSGVSVRRIRFYSDEGLLPPRTRTFSGYRVYSDADVARLDLIRALREAGVGLEVIKRTLARQLSLRNVLEMRLETLEAELASQRRIAAVLRATLRVPDPSERDLRRLWTMTHMSKTEFRAKVERFVDRVAEGTRMDESWRQRMIDINTPDLPEEPTPEQIDAWNEIMSIFSDEEYIAAIRADVARVWTDGFDAAAYTQASEEIFAKVQEAMNQGLEPMSEAGRALAQEWLERSARTMRKEPDEAFLAWHLEQYRKYHLRSMRYQELLAILRGDAANNCADGWRWLTSAMTQLVGQPA